jgi:FMN phosphatase YigB (HAD superfamily)
MTNLPHVVWDMGGIMYHYFTELMLDYGRTNGWPLDQIPLGPTGMIHDKDYERLVAGEFDEPEYLQRILSNLADLGIVHDPTRDLSWDGRERSETWATIERIHDAGHRQALLTNDASKWLGPDWWETWGPSRWFESIIDVVMVGVRKPAPEPYLAAASALHVPPTECLFVDDMPVNCRGAEAVGMKSHLFEITDPAGSLHRLEKRLGID